MTIIRSNSISGINSITAAPGANLQFFDSTGASLSLDTGNVNAGVVTATTVRVTGDLTVEGTTTTLDTVVTEVDKLEVSANNTTVGVAITQSGSGDILRLYDGASQVVTVDDQGNFGIGAVSPIQKLHIGGSTLLSNNNYHYGYNSGGSQTVLIGITGSNNILVGQNNVNHTNTIIYGGTGTIQFSTGGDERIRITSGGNVGIGTDNPQSFLSLRQDGGGFEVNANSGSNNARLLSYDRVASAYREMTFQALSYGFETSGTEKVRITSSGNIGIGNTNPLYAMHFKNAMSSTPSYIHMEVTGTNTVGGGGGIQFDTSASNNQDNNSLYLAQISGERSSSDDGSNQLVFKTTNAGSLGDDGNANTPKTRMIIDEDGHVTISDGNLIIGTSGHGIDFSATSDAAGMTSELLDDYEEGTWTPTVFPASGSFTSFSYQVRSGSYTKIGNMVYLRCNFYTNGVTVGTASGNISISGLPFAAGNVAGGCLHDVRHWANNPSTVTITGSFALIYRRTSFNANDGRMQVTDLGTGNPGNLCQFSGSYQIS